MAITIKQTEAVPANYPSAPAGLSTAAAALAPAVVWLRIESWIAHRWGVRNATWVVEGPGEWHPPLTPATITTVHVWSSADVWETATLAASPLGGYYLPASGPYRFVGSVGVVYTTTPPATLREAYRRLAEYLASKPGKPGATSDRITAGSISIGHTRSESWMASAMANSGAADLLRGYRRV